MVTTIIGSRIPDDNEQVPCGSSVNSRVRSFVDDNPPGNHREREALRRDQRGSERLTDQRCGDIREGVPARNARVQRKYSRQEKTNLASRREIYGNDHDRRHDRRDTGGGMEGERFGYRDRTTITTETSQ